MSKKIEVDVGLNVSGFKEGAQELKYQTDVVDHSLQQYVKDIGPLNKQLRQAKNEAKNLAAQFRDLSEAEKNTEWGQEIKANLDAAVRKAAELQDVMSDTDQAIRHAADDSLMFKAGTDAMDALGDATLSVVGVLAQATGKTEDFQKAMTTWLAVEKGLSAIKKINNMLQKQSNVMVAIGKIQELAAAKATDLHTASTVKATIAQKAFNTVAKANPYVLLASAIIAVGTALAAFTAANNKAKKAQEEETKALEEAQQQTEKLNDAYKSKFTSTLSEQLTQYYKLQKQWESLKSSQEKNEFIRNNAKAIQEYNKVLGKTYEASELFSNQTDNIVAALTKRAKAAAYTAQAQLLYQQALEKTIQLEHLQEERIDELAENKRIQVQAGNTGYTRKETEYEFRHRIAEKYFAKEKQIVAEREELYKKAEDYIKQAVDTGAYDDIFSGGGNDNEPPKIKAIKGSLSDLEQQLSDLQKKRKDGLLPELDAKQFQEKVDDLTNKIKEKKIELGLELRAIEPEQNSEAYFKKAISEIDVQLQNVEIGSDSWRRLTEQKHQLEQEQLNLKATIKEDELRVNIQDIVNKAFEQDKEQIDFSFLSEQARDQAEQAVKQLGTVESAMAKLNEVMANKDGKFSQIEIDEASTGILILTSLYDNLAASIKKAAEENEGLKKKAEEIENIAKMTEFAGNALTSFGDIFTNLGKQSENIGLQVAGIVANTIANLALSYANAMKGVKDPYTWTAFGISGMAQLIAMSSQIRSLVGYRQGGIVKGGVSLHDNAIAAVSSGEMILNQRQQDNLFKAIDQDKLGGGNFEIVGYKVKGTDMVLLIQNTLKAQHKKSIL